MTFGIFALRKVRHDQSILAWSEWVFYIHCLRQSHVCNISYVAEALRDRDVRERWMRPGHIREMLALLISKENTAETHRALV